MLYMKFNHVGHISNKRITSYGHLSLVVQKEEIEEKIIHILMVVCGEIERIKLMRWLVECCEDFRNLCRNF